MPCVVENLNEGLAKKLCLSVKKKTQIVSFGYFLRKNMPSLVRQVALVMIPQIPQSYNNQLSQSNKHSDAFRM